jgi:transcriptional regulator with XRE-family HTH domain
MMKSSDTTKDSARAESLGATIRRLRKSQHLTQAQLANDIGVDESYISKIETGRLNYTPSQETLRLLAQVLKTDPLRLLALAEKTPDELKPAVESQKAREFFELVREQRLNNEDWQDLTHRLRHRLSKREKGGL